MLKDDIRWKKNSNKFSFLYSDIVSLWQKEKRKKKFVEFKIYLLLATFLITHKCLNFIY